MSSDLCISLISFKWSYLSQFIFQIKVCLRVYFSKSAISLIPSICFSPSFFSFYKNTNINGCFYIFITEPGCSFESLISESWACTDRDTALKPSGKHSALSFEITLIWTHTFLFFSPMSVLICNAELVQ